MSMNRRQFLTTTLVGAGTIILGGMPINAGPVTDPFQIVPLGKTGIKVSLIGMGTGMRGYNNSSSLTRMDKNTAQGILRHAYEMGVRYFDCADLYGSHQLVGETLKEHLDKITICSKMWVRGGKSTRYNDTSDAVATLDRFRKELGRDTVDFVQLHCMTDAGWFEKYKPQAEAMEKLKEKGIIKAHGLTVHSTKAMETAVDNPWVDVIHVRINASGDSMDDKDPAKVYPIVQKLHDAGKGVIGMKLIGEGRYGKTPEKPAEMIDQSIAKALGMVNTMIVGFEEEGQIDDFAARVKKALEARAKAMA